MTLGTVCPKNATADYRENGAQNQAPYNANSKTYNTVLLFSCNGATVSNSNDSVAGNLAYLTGGGVWAVSGGSINYPLFDCIPYSKNGAWSYTKGRISVIYN